MNQVPRLAAILLLTFGTGVALYAQRATPAASPALNEEIELLRARRRREDAQTEYYLAQTKRLDVPLTKPLSTAIFENPVSLVGIAGASFAAMVALLTFLLNYRATLRAQKDAQFYEALRRFGDMDSPTVRSSAAGIIAQMGKVESRYRKHHPYLETSLDQLIAGLLLEENPVCIQSITDGINKLIPLSPPASLKITDVVNKLEHDLATTLAEFWAVLGHSPPDNLSDRTWKQASHWTGYDEPILLRLIDGNRKQFLNSLQNQLDVFSKVEADQRKKMLFPVQDKLKSAGHRLQASVNLVRAALGRSGGTDLILPQFLSILSAETKSEVHN